MAKGKKRRARTTDPNLKGSGKFVRYGGKMVELSEREALSGGVLRGYKDVGGVKSGRIGKKKGIKLSAKEAAGGGIMSGYKKVRKVAKVIRKDPLDKLGISRRKFMKTRLGRRLLELSAKQLQKDFGLLDDLIDRFKESRS